MRAHPSTLRGTFDPDAKPKQIPNPSYSNAPVALTRHSNTFRTEILAEFRFHYPLNVVFFEASHKRSSGQDKLSESLSTHLLSQSLTAPGRARTAQPDKRNGSGTDEEHEYNVSGTNDLITYYPWVQLDGVDNPLKKLFSDLCI